MFNVLPAHLKPLPDFTQLSDRVWRVMGLNPGVFTLQGTNTYLVGAGPRKVLIDCGQREPGYLPLLESSLRAISPDAYVSDILITHCHPDHWGGLDMIYSHLGAPRVHKFPLPSGCHDEEHMDSFPEDILVSDLYDGQIFEIDSETCLEVVYTGGHCKDHCSFWLPQEECLFTGDCVLGHGTVVFDDLSEYLTGLQKLLELEPKSLYPGHGAVVEDGMAKIKHYIQIRQQREEQILNVISSDQTKRWTPIEIGEKLGDSPRSETMYAAFVRGIALHLEKLQKDGKAKMLDGPIEDSTDILELVNKEWLFIGQCRL